MKKYFELAEIEVIILNEMDIIVTSSGSGVGDDTIIDPEPVEE